MEKNADIVVMNCYAPMFVNVNPGARQWRPNLIGYDGLRVYGSPSYYAIKMFSTHLGDQILKATPTDTDVLVSATRDTRAGRIHVKLVNPTEAAAPVQLDLTGAADAGADGDRGDALGGAAGHQLDRRAAGGGPGDLPRLRRQIRFHLHGPGARHRRADARGALRRHVGGAVAPAARRMGHRRRAPAGAAVVGRRGRRITAPRPPAFEPGCYLCPGNARVGGAVNPRYTGTFVFDNDHPCVGADGAARAHRRRQASIGTGPPPASPAWSATARGTT